MKKLVFIISLAAATAVTTPMAANAQGIPARMRPPRGMCRVWVPGRALGRQPAVMSCAAAKRLRPRYGNRAFVVFGPRFVSGPAARRRSTRVFYRSINGRRCRVVETWQYGRRVGVSTNCRL